MTTKASPPLDKIKKELPNDEIKVCFYVCMLYVYVLIE